MKTFILYDGRARIGDTDDAGVIDTADSAKEARRLTRKEYEEYDYLWCEYDRDSKNNLTNEVKRFDLSPRVPELVKEKL